MALILSLESSAKNCTVNLSKDGESVSNAQSTGEWQHSKEITVIIRQVLQFAGKEINDLDAVALSQGPGSYTGLRVGASCAKGICFAMDIPLIAIDTLKIIAWPFLSAPNRIAYEYIIPTIDARRDEVYYTVYDKEGNIVQKTDNKILFAESFSDFENAVVCGDAAPKASKILQSDLDFVDTFPDAHNMSALAYARYTSQSFEDVAYFNPFYLKMPNITKSKKGILPNI